MPIFSIKICCHYLWHAILTIFMILKCFKWARIYFHNSKWWKLWNWFTKKINELWWGPHICDWSIDWLIDLIWLWYMIDLSCSLTCMLLFFNCALTLSLDSVWWLVAQVHTYFPFGCCLCMSWFLYVYDHSRYSLIYSSIAMSASFY